MKSTHATIYKMSITGSKEYSEQIKKCTKLGKELELQLKKLAKMKITPVVARTKRK